MNKLVCLLFILLGITNISAQKVDTAYINSLNKEGYTLASKDVNNAQEKLLKALSLSKKENYSFGKGKSLYYLAITHLYKGNYDSTLNYTNTALEIFREINATNDYALCINLSGVVYRKQEQYDDALRHHKKALAIFDKKKYKGSVLSEIGSVYYDLRNFDSSKFYYSKAIEYMQSSGDSTSLIFCYRNLGLITKKEGNYKAAMSYYLKALKGAEELNNELSIAHIHSAMASVYHLLKDENHAIKYYKSAIENYTRLGHLRSLAASYADIATVYRANNKDRLALEHNFKALEFFEKIGAKRNIHLVNNNIGIIHMGNKEYAKADSFYKKALAIAQEINYQEGIVRATNNLGLVLLAKNRGKEAYNIYSNNLILIKSNNVEAYSEVECLKGLSAAQKLLGNYKEAYITQLKADSLEKELFSLEKVSGINQLKADYEKEQAASLIKEEQAKATLFEKDRNLLFAAVLFLSIVAIGTIIFIKYKSKQKSEVQEYQLSLLGQELKKKEKELVTAALNIANKHELLEDVKSKVSDIRNGDYNIKGKANAIISSIDRSISDEKEWKNFLKLFEDLHPNFIKALTQKYPTLNQSDIRLCALYKLNLSNHEVKNILNITTTSLTTARYRLRKKLYIDSKTELSAFLTQIGGKD